MDVCWSYDMYTLVMYDLYLLRLLIIFINACCMIFVEDVYLLNICFIRVFYCFNRNRILQCSCPYPTMRVFTHPSWVFFAGVHWAWVQLSSLVGWEMELRERIEKVWRWNRERMRICFILFSFIFKLKLIEFPPRQDLPHQCAYKVFISIKGIYVSFSFKQSIQLPNSKCPNSDKYEQKKQRWMK